MSRTFGLPSENDPQRTSFDLADGAFGPQYSKSGDSNFLGTGPWQRGDQLTVSFVPDGTQVLNQESTLFQTFAWMLTEEKLQEKVLQAFQVWSRTTNLNVGLVEDEGAPIGTRGLRQHDLRFGDIRISAIEMALDVYAVAIPSDNLAAGTWSGEIIFNSNAAFENSRQFYQVALHEAGHVLGLEHSADPNSPMHRTEESIRITATDVQRLRQLYGVRRMDVNEREGEHNDIIEEATSLEFPDDFENGELPLVAFGDLRFNDVDYFKVSMPSDYTGRLTFRLKSEGLSVLAPAMTIYNKLGELVRFVESTSVSGDNLVTSIPNVVGSDKFFIKIEGKSPIFGIGTFAVGAIFHANTTMGWKRVETLIESGIYNREEQDDFWEALLDPDAPLNDDQATNDSFANATLLNTTEGFIDQSYYNVQGSLATPQDVDFFIVKTSAQGLNGLTNMNVLVDSVQLDGLIPTVEVFDTDFNPVRSAVLINSNGQLSNQALSIAVDQEYFVKISANQASQNFIEGNYRLTVNFDETSVRFRRFGAGVLSAQQALNEHTLHVAQSQILHINLLASRVSQDANAVIWLTVYDELGNVRFRSATRPGETRSANSVLFSPGSYAIRVELALPDGSSPTTDFSYLIRGHEISDSQGPKLIDPTDSPFPHCNPGSPVYCYPNNQESVKPYIFVEESYVETTAPPTPWVDINNWYWYADWLTPEVPPNL